MITGLSLSQKVSFMFTKHTLYLPKITSNVLSEARDTLSLSPIPDFCTYGDDSLMGVTERGTGICTSNLNL